GPDASNVTGIYNNITDKIRFTDLELSIPDGESETYTINAYFNDNSDLTDGKTYILSIDGDSDFTVDGSGTQMGTTTPVTNDTGSKIEINATKLAFTTQPDGSVSGSALTTQPVVSAVDDFGNIDADFTETITLTE